MTNSNSVSKTKVLILGAGELGQALQKVLSAKSDISIEMWDKDKSRVPGQRLLNEAIPEAQFLFLCLPSWCYRSALEGIMKSGLKPGTIVVSFAKGLEEKSGKTTSELLEELLPKDQPFALVSGPMLAEELSQGLFGMALAASVDRSVAGSVIELYSGTNLQLKYTDDVRGIALIGVLKNIYAIGLGIAQALSLGDNFRGWYIGQVLNEMIRIIESLGGRKETVLSSAAIGDLVATGFSRYSKNHELGEELVTSGTITIHSEGLTSLPALLNILSDKASKLTLLTALKDVIIEKKDTKEIFEKIGYNPM